MGDFEALLALLVVAVVLAGIARKLGVPYPALLALGGAGLAFTPGAPGFTLDPRLALALFVAPVLLDAAYDASPRDLKDHWVPLLNLVVFGVGLTTIAVAWVVHLLEPAMPWAAAVALGAIVSPPDATAATAVLRHVKPPHRILTILEGESLLNDASALLVYRLALAALTTEAFSLRLVAPTLLWVVVGSIVVGVMAGRFVLWATRSVTDPPSVIILQFVNTFGIWIVAERLNLSGVLTTVSCAMSIARPASASTPASIRVPSYAVWDTVVFVVNVLAFVFIGLQIRPILVELEPVVRVRYLWVAGAVLLTVVAVRFAWVLIYYAVVRWHRARTPARHSVPGGEATFTGALVVSWAGMRGIVTLAAALAIPLSVNGAPFPYRDLIVLTAFAVVLGTLVIQGLTLGRVLRRANMHDDQPIEREVRMAREHAWSAALATFDGQTSAVARAVREEFAAHLRPARGDESDVAPEHEVLHRDALNAARRAIFAMRERDEIGDAAYHRLEAEFDMMELANAPPEDA